MPDVKAEVVHFRKRMASKLIAFDPLTIAERRLITLARNTTSDSVIVEIPHIGETLALSAEELLALQADIDSQIVARDFKLIDQSDMVVAYVPKVAGRLEISAGVIMEIQHAWETGKEVHIICPDPPMLSPFITEHATSIYRTFEETVDSLERP